MREILFRGKRIDNDEWIEGFYCPVCFGNRFPCRPAIVPKEDMDNGYWHPEKVDPSSVGQFTGLTDKNGKRIFEGDIIKTHYANAELSDHIERVVFRNGKFCGEYTFETGGKMYAPLADGVEHIPQDKSVYMEWCEIIGNIHDNPELLEVSGND